MSDFREQVEQLSPARRQLFELLLKRESTVTRRTALIPRLRESNRAPLSFAQQRLWLIDKLEPGNVAYNIPVAIRLKGWLSVTAMGRALQEIIRRHEVLRTTFAAEGGTPIQVIHPNLEFALPVDDLTHLPARDRETAVRRMSEEEGQRPFDLEHGPLLRARLVRLDQREHVALLTMHHIVFDGWSAGVFINEVATLYRAFTEGKPSPLPPLPLQYADFAEWQRAWLEGETLETHLAYWKKQLHGVATLAMPADRPHPPVSSYRGANQTILLPEDLCEALRELSKEEGATLFMVLLAGFQILLRLYTGQDDIVVGTDIANRTHEETEKLIGFFVNMLALRTGFSGNPTCRESLRRVKQVTLGAYAHQDLPFEKLVAALQLERDLSRFPVFQAVFVMQNTPPSNSLFPDLEMSPVSYGCHTVKFDFILFITPEGKQLRGNLDYRTDLFDYQTITCFLCRFEHVLRQLATRPDAPIRELELLTEQEQQQLHAEEQQKREAARLKFRTASRRGINLTEINTVKTSCLSPGETLPLVVEPSVKGCNLVKWAANHRNWIDSKLVEHGAILWRGFRTGGASGFEQAAAAMCAELFGEYGDLPRAGVGGKIYGATPYPHDQAILFHNESSHMHRWPMKIFFYCVTAPQQGGATPIVDCRKVYRLLDSALRERFRDKKIVYVRNYTNSLDVSWQDFFHTTDRAIVEQYCNQAGIEFEWKSGGELRTRRVCQAIARHPQTGEFVFFNQLQLHHVSCLERNTYQSLQSLFNEEDYPRNVCYGDSTPLEASVVDEIRGVYGAAAVRFTWQPGDILMLDNMLTAHGRDAFEGPREIVVALGDMITDAAIECAAAAG